MTWYYFRVYKRNKEFKNRKSLKPLHKFFINFFNFLDEKFFFQKIYIVNYSSEIL